MEQTQSLSKQASKQVEIIGCMDHTMDNTFESANRVYDVNGVAPTMNTCGGGGLQPKILEVKKLEQCIVAMRGRNPENPSDRTPGIETEQRLEINSEGICNTITSVQKDNLVLETNFIAYDEQNKCIREDVFGTLTTDGSSPKHNNRVIESKKIKIRQATKDGFVVCEIGGVVDLEYPSSETRRGRVIEDGKICPTLTTENIPSVIELGNSDFYNFLYEIDGDIYLIRIRKLVPLECWRLMGFSDNDFNKASEVNSNTQLYKQAGNSIVKQVLMAIMSQLNIKGVTPWNKLSEKERIDLSGKIKNQTSDK